MDKVERLQRRLERKQRKQRVKTITTPYPISCCVTGDLNGNALRYMFPCSGKITKIAISFNSKPKEVVVVNVNIEGELGVKSEGFKLDKKTYSAKVNIDVYELDKLTVAISSTEAAKVNEVWIAFLWEPIVKDASVRSFLVEELHNDETTER